MPTGNNVICAGGCHYYAFAYLDDNTFYGWGDAFGYTPPSGLVPSRIYGPKQYYHTFVGLHIDGTPMAWGEHATYFHDNTSSSLKLIQMDVLNRDSSTLAAIGIKKD